MNGIREEYLGPVNGNGNGHEKIFGLQKTENPLLAGIVPAARRKVCENTQIPESARMFFCWLTDTSLSKGVYTRPGVVHFADSYLAQRFGVSRKTIQNWRDWVCSTGEVWCTELRMKNSFPKTVYNLTSILGQQMPLPISGNDSDGYLSEDAILTSNRFRLAMAKHEKGTGKFACRAHGVSGCPLCRAKRGVYTPPLPPRSTATSKKANKIHHLKKFCRPPRQMVAVENGKKLPSRESLKTLV